MTTIRKVRGVYRPLKSEEKKKTLDDFFPKRAKIEDDDEFNDYKFICIDGEVRFNLYYFKDVQPVYTVLTSEYSEEYKNKSYKLNFNVKTVETFKNIIYGKLDINELIVHVKENKLLLFGNKSKNMYSVHCIFIELYKLCHELMQTKMCKYLTELIIKPEIIGVCDVFHKRKVFNYTSDDERRASTLFYFRIFLIENPEYKEKWMKDILKIDKYKDAEYLEYYYNKLLDELFDE